MDGSSCGFLADKALAMTDVDMLRKDAREIFDLYTEDGATIGPDIFPKLLRGSTAALLCNLAPPLQTSPAQL